MRQVWVLAVLVLLLLSGPAAAQDGMRVIATGVEAQERVGMAQRSLPVRLTGGLAGGTVTKAWLDGAEVPVLCASRARGCGVWLPEDLAPGKHTARVRVALRGGGTRDVTWGFETGAADAGSGAVTVDTNAGNREMYEQSELVVTARGPRGGKATAYVDDISFPLPETSPGEYRGTYLVGPQDHVLKKSVVVRIESAGGRIAAGQSADQISMLGQFYTVDLITPTVGQEVGWTFMIKGRTRPGATVEIQPSNGRPDWRGTEIGAYPPQQMVVTTPHETIDNRLDDALGSFSAVADERGYFEVPFDLGPRILKPRGLTLYVGAVDASGEKAVGSSVSVKVK